MNVIRIPTKFLRPIKRLDNKKRLDLFDALISIGNGDIIPLPDNDMGDLLQLIYGEWMNMESRNGTKPKFNHISESLGEFVPSDSAPRVEYNRVEESIVEYNINISSNEEIQKVTEQKEPKEEIKIMQKFLRQAVGVSAFKEKKELGLVKDCYSLMKQIGKDEFRYRLEKILEDPFKQKNSNKLAYLYAELKAFIHSPIVKTKDKGKVSPNKY